MYWPTQSSIRHRCKGLFGDGRKALPAALTWWTEPSRIDPQSNTAIEKDGIVIKKDTNRFQWQNLWSFLQWRKIFILILAGYITFPGEGSCPFQNT